MFVAPTGTQKIFQPHRGSTQLLDRSGPAPATHCKTTSYKDLEPEIPGTTTALERIDRSLAVVIRSSSQAKGPVRFGGCAEVEPLRSPAERGRLSQVGSLRQNSGGGVPGRVSRDAWKVPALAHPPTRFAASTVRKLSDLDGPRGGGLARPSFPLRGSGNRASTFRCLTLTGRPFRGAARPRSGPPPIEAFAPIFFAAGGAGSVPAQGQSDVPDRVRSRPQRPQTDTGVSLRHEGQEKVN